jgi:hypothetical protein
MAPHDGFRLSVRVPNWTNPGDAAGAVIPARASAGHRVSADERPHPGYRWAARAGAVHLSSIDLFSAHQGNHDYKAIRIMDLGLRRC